MGVCLWMHTGLTKAAKEEHARDLPIMNGIKEYIKSVGVLDSVNPGYREALFNLSARLKSLQVIKLAQSLISNICACTFLPQVLYTFKSLNLLSN